jgi:protein phosphatase
MGTTLTAALFERGRLTYLNVGDSRLYERRAGLLRRLTRDDSWIEQLAEASGLDRAHARGHPMRHLLTSAVGTRGEIAPVVEEVELTAGQLLLMCTDGLHGELSEGAIDEVLASAGSPEEAVDRLVQAALEHGGKDNITALVARFVP